MKKRKDLSPFNAFFLSLLCPGLGHLYIGQGGAGFGLMLFYLLLLIAVRVFAVTFFVSIAITALALVWYFFIAVRAFKGARVKGETDLVWFNRWYALLGVTITCYLLLAFAPKGLAVLAVPSHNKIKVAFSSMEPTVLIGDDVVFGTTSFRGTNPPARGDIVVYLPPREPGTPDWVDDLPIVGRIIALPGETVEVQGSSVFIDGQPLIVTSHQ